MVDGQRRQIPKRSLVAIVGVTAAAFLMRYIPQQESGREVKVEIPATGGPKITHVSGKQYLSVYLDIAGVATACDGLTRAYGVKLKLGQKFTEQQCNDMLQDEIAQHAERVMACTPFDKDKQPYQIVNAVDMDFNTGGWCGSTSAKMFKLRNWRGMCDATLAWDKARVGGVLRPVKGLTDRRRRSWEACTTGLIAGKTPENLQARMRAVK